MNHKMMKGGRPKIAIIDPNTFAVIGLKGMLQNILPIMTVDSFASVEELKVAGIENYFHYFAAMNVVVESRSFFHDIARKTIVLTTSNDPTTHLSEFKCLCVNMPEDHLVKALLALEQYGHPHGKNLPDLPKALKGKILSDREIEVLSLVAQGKINKEIADQLNISLTTVISHRKNIQEKLGIKSVSALTIYAVMHGYVDINKI
ncbi:response regulator transcription factor [Segatella albensis]|uniref:response regulator transcription factor n=1 Tax=Segatella albensis TaxID=77768 RepID=UPI00047FF4E7|nr:response regulator transcription factor [Segatella albensis]